MTVVSQKASSKFSVDMWVGDLEAFSRLIAVCRELQAEAERLALADADLESGRDRFMKDYSFLPTRERNARWKADLAQKSRKIAKALELRMTSTQRRFDQEFDGSPESVLEEIDLDDLKSVSLQLGSIYSSYDNGGFGLALSMDRTDGCTVRVAAPKSDWLVLANEKLKIALRGRRPWFWFLRRFLVLIPAISIAVAVPTVSLLSTIPQGTFDRNASVLIYSALTVTLPFVVAGLTFGVRRLIPAFELYRAGASARGPRVIALVVSGVAWLAALIVPLFLQRGA